jgi:hypothetical protein
MVLGSHGRRLLYPMTPLQGVLTLPWSKLYKQSLYFRTVANVFVGTLAIYGYIGYKGKLYKQINNALNEKYLLNIFLISF